MFFLSGCLRQVLLYAEEKQLLLKLSHQKTVAVCIEIKDAHQFVHLHLSSMLTGYCNSHSYNIFSKILALVSPVEQAG